MYSEVGGLYAPTKLEDIRPVSGIFEDVQQTLVANFLFDDDTAQLIVSAAPSTSTKPRLQPEGTTRDIAPCVPVATAGGAYSRFQIQVLRRSMGTSTKLLSFSPMTLHSPPGCTARAANNAGQRCQKKVDRIFHG